MANEVQIGDVKLGAEGPFFVIAGPCVIENEEITLTIAYALRDMAREMQIFTIFKASYDKANRTSLHSFRGPGFEKGLEILSRVKRETGLPVLSDVHHLHEVEKAASVLDVIQIPAFLCRQTDLVLKAADTGLAVNLKKGQFLSPWEMAHIVDKATSTGNHGLLLTERGTQFGYNNLVVDIRSIAIMKRIGYPVVFDATHSVQLPGAGGGHSGGQREFVEPLARAAVAAGADGVFMEVHPEPDKALCDGANSLPLTEIRPLIHRLKEIYELLRS